jgi:hypothetical protein
VRSDPKDSKKPLALELYKIPDDNISTQVQEVQVTWPRSVHTPVEIPSLLLHVSISAVPCSADGEDAASVLTAHAEPPPVSVFVVTRDPWQTVQFRLWPERIAKAEVGLFRPDGQWQDEIQEPASPPPSSQPVPLKDTTFRFQLYGPFFKIISYTYRADPALGPMRILPGTTRPLLVVIPHNDRRATPALHDLWAYADLAAPPAPQPRWPDDEASRTAREAERGWIYAALKSRESPAVVAQLSLPQQSMREKFKRGLVAIEWDDWSMSLCGVCVDEPNLIYLFQFAPTPTEGENSFDCFYPMADVLRPFPLRFMIL